MCQLQRYDYTISAENAGVLHIGVGSFHRSHQAVYFDDLLAGQKDKNWAIIGVNLRDRESPLVEYINRRSGHYVLKTVSDDGDSHYREIRSIAEVVDWVKDSDAAHNLVALPQIKMVTITVTESGYYIGKDERLDSQHQLISKECRSGESLGSVFGFLREGLKRRMQGGGGKLTILCCDNLRHNGKLLRDFFYQYLHMSQDCKALCDWVDEHVTFPCSMVDRITPSPSPELQAEIASKFNIKEQASVNGEEFTQWVIENNFASDAPPLQDFGALLVDDVTPYEDTKIRILNGGHTSLAYFGALQGYRYFDEIIKAPEWRKFYDDFQSREVIPTLKADFKACGYDKAGIDFEAYAEITKRRFSNPIKDTVARIATDGSVKIACFILPTVRGRLRLGQNADLSATIIASWFVFLQHALQGKIPFAYDDARWLEMAPSLVEGDRLKRRDFLHSRELWQELPQSHPHFMAAVDDKISLFTEYYHG